LEIVHVARNHPSDHFGLDFDRRPAELAVQLGLGYYPSGGIGLVLVIILILVLLGRI
jgi:Protein of unknown function (DUF3309)